MQRFKGLVPVRRSLHRLSFLSHHQRNFSAQPNYAHYDDIEDQVLVEGRAKSRAAILNRPASLNAITTSMAARLKRLYQSWEENPDIGFVVMKGTGKAFCTGGDVVTLYQLHNQGEVDECKKFFETLYKLIYHLGTYLKPHVAIMDGITMGGGAGICIPAMFRVVTDKTVFATPETQMGFHPDAGASFYLSRLPGYLGEYLALTGEKLNGVEMIASGLATHYSLNARLALVEERLGTLVTDDRSVIETSLAQYGDLVYPDKRSVLHKIDTIDRCFSHDTVEEIIDALQSCCRTVNPQIEAVISSNQSEATVRTADWIREYIIEVQEERSFLQRRDPTENQAADTYDEWCTTSLKKLKEASPLSLKVSLRSIREGRFQPLDQCLAREYRMSLNGISKRVSNDFHEGVRARFVDKDFAPKWDPPSLTEVSKDMVDGYFSRLDEESELELPTALREPYI